MDRTTRLARIGVTAAIIVALPARTAFAEITPSIEAPAEAMTPPTIKTRADAIYPPDALRDRLEGKVGLEVDLDETGKVLAVRVTASAGHGFDEAAVAAVRLFTFAPAHRGDVAIRSTAELTYEFHPPAVAPVVAPVPVAAPAPAPSTPTTAPSAAPPVIGAPPTERQDGPGQSTLVVAARPLSARLGEPDPAAASDNVVGQQELAHIPRFRTENLLEAVPGLFSVQHAGGGKSQQYFLRGFDADHGTDIAFFVDGAPINAVSHGHGQGYSDLHFLIPETVGALESTKGPYSARVGDFATAGSVSFHMLDSVDESYAKAELGPDGHKRTVALESPDLGENWRMLLAFEAFDENGPFIHPENYDRLNAYMKVTRTIDTRSEVSLLLQGYGGSWNMSGVLPARAVCGEGDGTPVPAAYAGSHCLSRWDSVDPSQGGSSQRVMALATYRRQLDDGDIEATLFTLHSNLQLFPNDGIASDLQPSGILYGSQVEQDDTRTESGASLRITKRLDFFGIKIRSTVGLQLRNDAIESQLHRTEQRHRLDGMPGIPGPITDSAINETELAPYIEEDIRFTPWLRLLLGAREDRVDVAVNNESATAVDQVSGYRGASQFSPKGTLIVSPTKELDLFANFGRGFHSNDGRTLIEGTATTLLAIATGYEVGATVRPIEGLVLSAVAFRLDLTSELTIDGDTASTSPSGPTRRYGGEFTGRYMFRNDIYADAAFTMTHARYTDAADIAAGQAQLALAPVRTFSAGIGAREPVGPTHVFGSFHVRAMSDRPGTQDGTLTATGFVMLDAELGVRWKNLEVAADLLNVANVDWREGQFAVNSRLPSEGPNPPVGMSFTPGIPRTLLAHASLYW